MNPTKHSGASGPPQPSSQMEDVHKQMKPPTPLPSSTVALKPVPARPETTVKPPSAQGMASQAAVPAGVKPVNPNKEPMPSAKKPTSGPAPTTAASNVVRPAVLGSSAVSPATKAGAAESSMRSYLGDSEQLGVMYPRATTLSEAVTGQVRMTEAMLDALKGGSMENDDLPVESFSKARPSVQQVRYPTPYPTKTVESPMETESLPGVRDVDGIEIFKKRRASLASESSTTSLVQQLAERQTSRKNMKAKSEVIDEEHQLSKGQRPLKSLLKSSSNSKRRKGVRFCDFDGTQLATVRYYFDQDEAPEVPLYATAYLNLDDLDDPIPEEQIEQIVLRPSFSQPGAAPDFLGRVHMNKVALEFCLVSDTDMTVTGTVRVANISFNKSVTVRYSIDEWKHTDEIKANYVYYAHDGATDRFSFIIQLPTTFGPGQQLLFAIRYDAGDETFWDNHAGQNYKVDCLTRDMLQMAANSSYMSSIHPNFTWLQYL